MNKFSVYGSTGFVGTRFCQLYPDQVIRIPRECREPQSENILYLISTNNNYHVFSDLTLDVKTNLLVLMEVLSYLKESKGIFNFISSWFVYGDVSLPAKENSACKPRGFYSITKYCAEELLISFCKTFGIEYRILRFSNLYGIGDIFSVKKNAFQFLLQKLIDGEKIELYYGGDFIRDYLYVDDACEAVMLCLNKAPINEIVNIGSGNPYRFGNLIEFARQTCNSSSEIVSIPPKEFHTTIQVKDMYLDVTKLSSFGFVPKIDIYTGIQKTLDELKVHAGNL